MPSSLNSSDYSSDVGVESMSDHANKINEHNTEQAEQQVNDAKFGGRKRKSRRKGRGKKSAKKSAKKSRKKKRRRRRKVQRGGNAEEVQEVEIEHGSDDDQANLQKNIAENMAQAEHNAKNDGDVGTMRGGRKNKKKKTVKVEKKKKKKEKKSKKKLNDFFKLMLDAKKKGLAMFKYNNNTYKGRKHKRLGMIYKKA